MSVVAASHLFPVLLAGGSGTRLWPLSTRGQPKQFLALGEMRSLLRQTADRLGGMVPVENLWIVCGETHVAKVQAELPELPARQILAEPTAKNTLAAIALAAIHLRARDPEAVMVVLPADHFIPASDWPKLHDNLRLAARVAQREKALVTIGIPPTGPETGFGYLEQGERFETEGGAYFSVRAFHEKPDVSTAERYFKQGGYFWNSGMFVWEAQVFLEELQKARPDTSRAFEDLALQLSETNYSKRASEVFAALENISVDYGLMEKARKVRMVPAGFAWDDVGALTSFEKILPSDTQGNHTQGDVFVLDSKDNLVIAQDRPVGLVGMEGVIVVETSSAILVLPKERAQDVKSLVDYLKKLGREDLL